MPAVDLTHHFLIAMPNMADPHFARTLTFICEHNEQGALGLVVNRPIDMTLAALFERINLDLNGARVAVQGFGNVGSVSADLLSKLGAKIVAVTDWKGGVSNPHPRPRPVLGIVRNSIGDARPNRAPDWSPS